ncbi:hypothetical protein B0H11DRAFT_1905509 [Mycena galericulata]|nr:hypothetical protein B0H11DRAFT_1905509 [Mycena galericulata]
MHLVIFITALFTPFAKLFEAISLGFTSMTMITNLAYTVAIVKGELAGLQNAVIDLLDVNVQLEEQLAWIAKEAETDKTAAAYYSDLADEQQTWLELGLTCVIDLLERLAVAEDQARNMQIDLKADLAGKDDTIASQAAQLETMCNAQDAAAARIATLEAQLVANARQHESQLLDIRRDQDARELATAQVNRAQASQIKDLSAQLDTLKTESATALARQAEHDARADVDAKQIRKQARNVKALKSTITQMEKNAVQALEKDVGRVEELKTQAEHIAALQTEVATMKADTTAKATETVVRQLQVTEHLASAENRARAAEERVTVLEKKQVVVAEKVKATVIELAARHAEELAAARIHHPRVDADMADAPEVAADIPATSNDSKDAGSTVDASFSLGCGFHFTASFIVRSQSSFAQASVTSPSQFARSDRKVVRRGGNSLVTPLLLPAWPELRRREENARASKRIRRE